MAPASDCPSPVVARVAPPGALPGPGLGLMFSPIRPSLQEMSFWLPGVLDRLLDLDEFGLEVPQDRASGVTHGFGADPGELGPRVLKKLGGP